MQCEVSEPLVVACQYIAHIGGYQNEQEFVSWDHLVDSSDSSSHNHHEYRASDETIKTLLRRPMLQAETECPPESPVWVVHEQLFLIFSKLVNESFMS